ncbi:transketolase [Persephonella hydrogeniphila]|uniref:Transketolase n=1 Tax=Persephonella hydrogeniphila TaxID=198703 RepID=A0A285NQJ7_9AQUI|nr:transketolase [Persephonella hydrogeniphila]SNZ11772.1 transketolase [Persephonella hydrogeniphila]
MENIDWLCINTIRVLSLDQIQIAKSGHPGMPLGASPMAYVLWDRFLKHNPKNPHWFNRDRFILSAGHASAMLYSLLHLYGYDLPLEELKRFRQWGSKTPGHPEYGLTPGVEATTGPLGQGFGMGVGMAIAECFLSNYFNRDGFNIVDHYTYAIVSDGDLMEGISSEAAALAGRLKLGKLIYLYDDNRITIDGPTDITWNEDIELRFKAHGWHVITVPDGEDLDAIYGAIKAAQDEKERPSLIRVRTHIGWHSPKQDDPSVHGAPLSEEEAKKTKKALGFPEDKNFYIPEEALKHFRKAVDRGIELEKQWKEMFEDYKNSYPELAEQFERFIKGELSENWEENLPVYTDTTKKIATRSASGETLNILADHIPNLIGGSADLAHSNKVFLKGKGEFYCDTPSGRNIHFGIREHAMGAAVNGMALHGGIIPFGATFFVFSDYMRASVRLAALMGVHSIFVYTHDSIGVGEDGPTHQPIEHLMSFRVMPDLTVIRPADANETVEAWKIAIKEKKPVLLVLTRQNVPVLDPDKYPVREGVKRGAYVLEDTENPDIILIGTGSEVHVCLKAKEILEKDGIKVRVVSMPSWELFFEQDEDYRKSVLPEEIPKVAVEAGSALGWKEIVGDKGIVIGMERFGASAPGNELMERFGFTPENVAEKAKKLFVSR